MAGCGEGGRSILGEGKPEDCDPRVDDLPRRGTTSDC